MRRSGRCSNFGTVCRGTLLLGAVCLAVAPTLAAERDQTGLQRRNRLVNPGFEKAAGWTPLGKGAEFDESVARSGRRSLRLTGASFDDSCGMRQVITFDPPVEHPIRVSGWSRAAEAEVAQDYNLYLDVHYADGTPLWGQTAHFEPGTHDWQYSQTTFDVAKPVQTIEVFVLFRKAKGTVWFDDLEVGLAPFSFRAFRAAADVYGPGSLGVFGDTSLPASWKASLRRGDRVVAEAQAQQMPVRLDWLGSSSGPGGEYLLNVTATDELLGESIRREQTLRLKPGKPGRDYAVWTQSSMRRVMPHALPPADCPARCQARVSLAGREYESFQVVLLPPQGRRLDDVRIEVGPLQSASGDVRIAARHVQWQQVGYVRLDALRSHPANPQATPGWWPDPLLPVRRFDVPSGLAQAIWVTVYAPADTPPGQYVGKLTVRPGNLPPAEIEIRAEVFAFSLPVRGHLKTAFALMDGFLERIYGKPLRGELRRKYGDFLLAHRLNPDDISRTAPPAIEDLLHYKDQGLNAFNVLNMVSPRGEKTWVCWSPLSVYTPQFKRQLIERLDPYVDRLRRHGLTDRAYVYTFDERSKEFFPIIGEYFGMIKERYPRLHTLTTAHVPQDPEVMRRLNIDWNCPLTATYRLEQAEKCRAAGLEVWAYICLGPGYPYANWLVPHPLVESRLIWWQAYHQKMDGFLYWGLNIWSRKHNDRPIDPAAGPMLDWSITTGGNQWNWLHGDGVLLYPATDGPIGSIRLANIRDGLEDYEYLWLLGDQAGDVEVARRECLPVAEGLTSFSRDPQVLLAQRAAIARKIAAGTTDTAAGRDR